MGFFLFVPSLLFHPMAACHPETFTFRFSIGAKGYYF